MLNHMHYIKKNTETHLIPIQLCVKNYLYILFFSWLDTHVSAEITNIPMWLQPPWAVGGWNAQTNGISTGKMKQQKMLIFC